MRRKPRTRITSRLLDESGQSMVLVVLGLGIFILGAIGFGVDFANFWFHRQAAQDAADAACTAGVMDMLSNANTGGSLGRFPGGNFDCATNTTAVPCQYASLNGYNGDGTTNNVAVSFVATSTIPGISPSAIGSVTNSIRIDVIDHVQAYFSALLTGKRTVDVHVRATCAVLKTSAPIPLIVLNPTCTDTFDPGQGTVAIVGGPSRSIEVNSSDLNGTTTSGSGLIDLTKGGPSFSGSSYGSVGTPFANLKSGSFPSPGTWSYPVTPIGDPYAAIPAPAVPTASTTDGASKAVPLKVAYHDAVYNCPDNKGCDVYLPGKYVHPIVVKGAVALVVPGLYYFNIPVGGFDSETCGTPGGCISKPKGSCNYALAVDSNGMVRTSTATGDGSGGVTFYLSGAGGAGGYGSVFFGSNAGKPPGPDTVDPYTTSGVKCPGGPTPDPKLNLPATVGGNVILGPCTQDGTYFNSPSNASTTGPVRGMIFFQDRANSNNDGQPAMNGGGGLVIAGTMYFHDCPNSTTTGCVAGTDYKAYYQLQGGSGSGTFLLGNITTDELIIGGNATVAMQLDSARVFTILKAAMVQ